MWPRHRLRIMYSVSFNAAASLLVTSSETYSFIRRRGSLPEEGPFSEPKRSMVDIALAWLPWPDLVTSAVRRIWHARLQSQSLCSNSAAIVLRVVIADRLVLKGRTTLSCWVTR